MTIELKKLFKTMPLDVTYSEYLILSSTLYASLNTMLSKNETVHMIDISTKKVYLLDTIDEIEKIKEFTSKLNFHLLNID